MDIYKELSDIQYKLDILLKLIGGDTVLMRVSDIAEMYGKPRTAMYTAHRYLLPNFGFDADGTSIVSEWTRGEVIEWNSRPVQERKDELKRMFPVNKRG